MDELEKIEYRAHVCKLELDKAEKRLSMAIFSHRPPFSIRKFEAEVEVYKIALQVINKQLTEELKKT